MSQYRLYRHEKGPLKDAPERGIYANPENSLYLRILLENGKESFKPCGTQSITEAIKMRDARVKAKALAGLGIAEEPDSVGKKAKVSVAKVISRYQADGYPDKKGVPRKAGKHLDEEIARCETLSEYFNGDAPAEDLDQDALDHYHTWRLAKAKEGHVKKDGTKSKPKGDGERTTDLELNALNNAYRWAARKKLIRINPIASRVRYHSATAAVHCREFAAEDADELHEAAGALMSSRRSETAGWQLLIEGMTGLRSEEAVMLRMDARATDAGGVHGEFVIEVRRSGAPAPLLLSPMLGKLLVHEKCDSNDGASAGQTGRSR